MPIFAAFEYGSDHAPPPSGNVALVSFYGQSSVKYWNLATAGREYDFGTWIRSRPSASGSGASSTRVIFMGYGSSGIPVTEVAYFTFLTKANHSVFGQLSTGTYAGAGVSSSTRAVQMAGYLNSRMEYFTISTLGNGTNFGNMTLPFYGNATAGSSTRGVSMGGGYGGPNNQIEYITIATTGNTTSFGTITAATSNGAGTSNGTRGVFAGFEYNGYSGPYYITIATTGNTTAYGALTVNRGFPAGFDDATYAYYVGGYSGSTTLSTQDRFLISSTGNATAWSSLATPSYEPSRGPSSNCHGALA